MTAQEFFENLPSKVNPEAVAGLTSCFHFDIADAGQFTLNLADGKLDVSKGLNGEASCKVSASQETLVGLLKKEVNPMMAMMTGKLKISNPGEMMKYAKVFGLM